MVVQDFEKRSDIIKTCFDLCREPITASGIRVAVESTAYIAVPQLESVCRHVATQDQKPGATTLRAIHASVDRASRAERQKQDAGHEAWCLPTIKIDDTRFDSQMRILHAWKKPESRSHWDQHEMAALRGELEKDSQRLAAANVKRDADLAHFAKYRRMP